MTDQVHLPAQILDANGDPESGALLYTYEAGTLTALTTYTDETLTTAHTNPIAADAEGRPPQVFYSGSPAIRVRITTGLGVEVEDFDPAIVVGVGTQASSVSFTPITDNAATNVQAAIAQNTSLATGASGKLENAVEPVLTGGAASAYTLVGPSTVTAYSTGLAFRFIANHTNTGAATLNVDTVGPVPIQKYDSSGTPVAMVLGEIIQGYVYDVVYTGTGFVIVSTTQATTDRIGTARFATNAEIDTGAGTSTALSISGGKRLFGNLWGEDGEDATTSGTEHDFTSIPSGTDEIVIHLSDVSLSGTDALLVQLIAGSVVTSGYARALSVTEIGGSTGSSSVTSTSGFPIYSAGAANTITGMVRLSRIPGTNRWLAEHLVFLNGTTVAKGTGEVDLGAALTGVRLTRDGSDTFDAGGWSIRYR